VAGGAKRTRILGHLNVFGDWYLALRVIEKAGRGFFVRKDLGRAYSIWLQEQKDIRAMEEAKREKIERLRAAIRRRLVDFFVARRIPMSDENIDTMMEEALAAESVEQYFAWLRGKYGEIPNGFEESAIGREETELEDIIVTPRAAQAIKDAEFSYDVAHAVPLASASSAAPLLGPSDQVLFTSSFVGTPPSSLEQAVATGMSSMVLFGSSVCATPPPGRGNSSRLDLRQTFIAESFFDKLFFNRRLDLRQTFIGLTIDKLFFIADSTFKAKTKPEPLAVLLQSRKAAT
jgi:hypothetical protein